MIHFFTGENSFALNRAIQDVIESWVGDIVHDNAGLTNQPEHIDGSELQPRDLPDLFTATTLFAQRRLIVIKGLSENTASWNALPPMLPRLSDDIDVVFADAKPDKRTSVFKALKAAANYQDFLPWTGRDTAKAETWLIEEAKRIGVTLDKKRAQLIVARAGVDQWELLHAIEKLSLLDEITEQTITDTIDAKTSDNVFLLFETAVRGNRTRVHEMIATFELTEEPYRLLGLLSTQAFQLAAMQSAKAGDTPVKDFGISPYAASKLSALAAKLTKADIRRIITAFADVDADVKSSRAEPWLLIEKALLRASSI